MCRGNAFDEDLSEGRRTENQPDGLDMGKRRSNGETLADAPVSLRRAAHRLVH